MLEVGIDREVVLELEPERQSDAQERSDAGAYVRLVVRDIEVVGEVGDARFHRKVDHRLFHEHIARADAGDRFEGEVLERVRHQLFADVPVERGENLYWYFPTPYQFRSVSVQPVCP